MMAADDDDDDDDRIASSDEASCHDISLTLDGVDNEYLRVVGEHHRPSNEHDGHEDGGDDGEGGLTTSRK